MALNFLNNGYFGGKLGVGDTTPLAKLEVAGSIKSTNYDTSHTSESGVTLGYNATEAMAYLETWTSKPLTIRTYNYQAFNISGSEAMRIDTNRNVGIGTTGPQALLDVKKDNATIYDPLQDLGQRSGTATIHITNQDTTTGSFGQIMYDSDGSNQGIARIVFVDSGTASVDTAFVNEHNNTKAERMRITSAGNVGIGTPSPRGKLDIVGNTDNDADFLTIVFS